jgi:acyl dehydratase
VKGTDSTDGDQIGTKCRKFTDWLLSFLMSGRMSGPSGTLQLTDKFRYVFKTRTLWKDEDAQLVLNNSVYLTLFEEARVAYFGKSGLNLLPEDQRFPFTLLSTYLRYVFPGKGAVNILVKIKTVELGRSSFTQEYKVMEESSGKVWCEGKAVLVAWDVDAKRKTKMSKHFRDTIEAFEGITEKSDTVVTDFDNKTLKIGSFAEISKVFGDQEVKDFAELSEDRNPVHLDSEYAKNSKFGKKIVHGALFSSLISALLGCTLPGPGTIYMSQNTKFVSPCFIGEKVTARAEIIKIHETKPIATLKTTVRNETGKILMDGEAVVMIPSNIEIASRL